jgi:MFS transporter, ACS family, glucarate transporter
MRALPKRYELVVLTFMLSLLLYIDRICISAAKEPIAQALNFSDKQMGWVLSAFALGYALCQTPAGILSDRMGPRGILSGVVAAWSLFTGLTAAAGNFGMMLVVRFLFGAGEAGAFPGMARAVYSWIPMDERGRVQGINFSGSRLGAAFALPLVAWMIELVGWRFSFVILCLIGFVWAIAWYRWFRNDPTEHPSITDSEREYILQSRQQDTPGSGPKLSAQSLFGSRNMWMAGWQYFCSNFTFFFCLSWLFPYLKSQYNLELVEAGLYAALPLLFGAFGNWFSGWLVDFIYRRGQWILSRKLTAIIGFILAAGGLIGSVYMDSAFGAVACLSLAIFGADMTLSPSWSFCIDIGKNHAGAVSGTMNMAGNVGSFITALAFPYLKDWTGSVTPFFFVGAALNVSAIFMWTMMRPDKGLEEY